MFTKCLQIAIPSGLKEMSITVGSCDTIFSINKIAKMIDEACSISLDGGTIAASKKHRPVFVMFAI